MARTFINQSSQIGNSENYSDTLTVGIGLQTGSVTVQDDLNALRTMVKAISGETNWYLAPTVSLFGLSGSLDAEIARALAAEGVLQGNIDSLSGSVAADVIHLDSLISAETSRALAAEGLITGSIAALSGAVSSDINALKGRVTTAEGNISSLIFTGSDHETRLGLAESTIISLDGRLDTAENNITTLISSASTLSNRIDFIVSNTDPAALDSLTEIVTAFQNADGNLSGSISLLATGLQTQINNLSGSTASDVNELRGLISNETTRATGAELLLSGAIFALENDRVLRTGDTMTGPLVFSGSTESSTLDPTELSVLNSAAGTNVEAGFISLFVSGSAALPTAPEHVATKLYVDNVVSSLDARTSKTYSVVTSAAAADEAVFGGGKLDVALPNMATGFESSFDVYLNGQLMRPGVGMDVVKASNDSNVTFTGLQFSFPLTVGDVICVVAYI